jgi:membrane-associated phospholipid phosphatase
MRTALRPLIPRLIAIVVLAVAFLALTVVEALGVLNSPDREVEKAMAGIWRDSLHPVFQGIAVLGGIELTSVLMIALTVFLWRSGFGADAFVIIAFVAAEALEIFYKSTLIHPAPPPSVAHDDGPSLSMLLANVAGSHNSYPSGHMVRTVIVYGLLAFVIRHLAPWRWARVLAVPIGVIIILVMAFDRVYLEVHWESDVAGGILLGSIALVSATVWLDRPRQPQN